MAGLPKTGDVREDGKVYVWAEDAWVSPEEYENFIQSRRVAQQIMGDAEDVAALNRYESQFER